LKFLLFHFCVTEKGLHVGTRISHGKGPMMKFKRERERQSVD
jgi:hypothetical protein